MDLMGMADPGAVPAEALSGLAFGIIKIVALGALGIVAFGFVMAGLCDIFECRMWRKAAGQTEFWRLMH